MPTTPEYVATILTAAGLTEGTEAPESPEQAEGGFHAAPSPAGVGVVVYFVDPDEQRVAADTMRNAGYRVGFWDRTTPPWRLWVWNPCTDLDSPPKRLCPDGPSR